MSPVISKSSARSTAPPTYNAPLIPTPPLTTRAPVPTVLEAVVSKIVTAPVTFNAPAISVSPPMVRSPSKEAAPSSNLIHAVVPLGAPPTNSIVSPSAASYL